MTDLTELQQGVLPPEAPPKRPHDMHLMHDGTSVLCDCESIDDMQTRAFESLTSAVQTLMNEHRKTQETVMWTASILSAVLATLPPNMAEAVKMQLDKMKAEQS